MNNSFIEQTADRLYKLYGNGISDIKIVLPSARARLFFNQSLASIISGEPIWQPQFYSIDSLTEKVTSITSADKLRLIVELYNIYSRYHTEPFDKFYYWGDVLLADFDTIDKYMVDARRLFINISDLKEIDNAFDYLTDEQAEVVSRFWSVFKLRDIQTKHQQAFLNIWNTLFNIYTEYKESLSKKGFGYQGMIYRECAEKLKSGLSVEVMPQNSVFAIIGFNALSKSEQAVFSYIKQNYTTHFFWDYDNYYIDNKTEEAGVFIRENMKLFPDELSDINHNYFSKSKSITIINSPSISLECKYVWNFLSDLAKEYQKTGRSLGKETAIVLTDESRLLPVMYSIPPEVQTFNITTGYAVSQTAAYSMLEYLISLQSNKRRNSSSGTIEFYHKDVLGVSAHPYFKSSLSHDMDELVRLMCNKIVVNSMTYISVEELKLFNFASLIFKEIHGTNELSDYFQSIFTEIISLLRDDDFKREKREYLTVIINSIAQVTTTISNCGITISESIFLSSLRKHITASSISFMGEPLIGVQVMGILETRSIDFENVLIIGVNEDSFPGNKSGKSFIPNSLRWGYGLPTPYHSEAMYSYYFYRLIQRSENVHITYCSKSEGVSSGEPSRYIHQLRLESPHKECIIEKSLSLSINVEQRKENIVYKDDRIIEKLSKFLTGKRTMSASAMFKYIQCPYSFYLRYIEDIREPDEVTQEMEATDFGNTVHEILEKIYVNIKGSETPQDYLSKIEDSSIRSTAIEIISTLTGLTQNEFNGKINSLLTFIIGYARNVINYDIIHSQFTHIEEEVEIESVIPIKVDGMNRDVKFYGRIDRLDRLKSGIYRIIDYKTGTPKNAVSSMEAIFDVDYPSHSIAIFQSLLYSLLWSKKNKTEVFPSIYYTRAMNSETYHENIFINKQPIEIFSEISSDFEKLLQNKLEELFSKDIPFIKTQCTNPCEWCAYTSICKM